MRLRRRMHAIGERIAGGRIAGRIVGQAAGQRRRGDLRIARGTGDVADAVGSRVGDDFLQQMEGIQRDHVQPCGAQSCEQGIVVGGRQLRAGGLLSRTARAELRGHAQVRDGRHQHVAGARRLQRSHHSHLRRYRRGDGGLRGRPPGDGDQVVGSAPHGVEGVGIGPAARARQVVGGLGGERRNGAERASGVGAGTGAADGIVGAALVVADRIGSIEVSHVLGPDQARIGGEAAYQRPVGPHYLDQRRAEMARIGEAVADEHRLRIRMVLGERRQSGDGQGQGKNGTDGTGKGLHLVSPGGQIHPRRRAAAERTGAYRPTWFHFAFPRSRCGAS